jgi:hypothetical protein
MAFGQRTVLMPPLIPLPHLSLRKESQGLHLKPDADRLMIVALMAVMFAAFLGGSQRKWGSYDGQVAAMRLLMLQWVVFVEMPLVYELLE